jgi:hypothetical protein
VSWAAPINDGRVVWNIKKRVFEGTMTYALPRPEPSSATMDDQFWLLPNRDLRDPAIRGTFSREQREFQALRSETEWPFDDSGLGALIVKSVSVGTSQRDCPVTPRDLKGFVEQTELRSVSFEFQQQERVLNVRRPASSQVYGCRLVRVDFAFHPRLGNGNFSQNIGQQSVFSGPFFPVWKDAPSESRILFEQAEGPTEPESEFLLCTGCRALGKTQTVLEFFHLPPPLHFQNNKSKEIFSYVNLNSVQLVEPREMSETLNVFRNAARNLLEKNLKQQKKPWRLSISQGVTIEQLVSEQEGEIQLHASFGSVTPLLTDYHSAALFRAVGRSLGRYLLQTESDTERLSWQQLRQVETVSRILAEIWVRDAYPKLSALKDLSGRLSFLPFFRAVQQGNAFVNNAVFVGAEESQSRLDYSLFSDFYSAMKGSEILERIDICTEPVIQKSIRLKAAEVLRGEFSISQFMTLLESIHPKADCIIPMESGIIPAWVPEEQIEILNTQKKRLKLRRKNIRPSPTFEFFHASSQSLLQEPLRLRLSGPGPLMSEQLIRTSGNEESVIDLPSSYDSFQVLEPNRAVGKDRLSYPRPIRTVLQALALNYDSRRSDLMVRSQFQTTQAGDEWGRTLLAGWRREESKNYLDLQVSTLIPSIIVDTRTSISLAATTRLVPAPPSFLAVSYAVEKGVNSPLYPEGVALKIWLRRPLTLSALNELMTDPQQEWLLTTAIPLAPRMTWFESLTYARSESAIDAGLRSVPGWPAVRFQSTEYAVVRSEIRNTLTQNLNASIARSFLFQHAIMYAAHVVAFDNIQAARQGAVDARTAQSILGGVRLLGALFGAKDQALSFELARALTEPARTSFGFTLGKSFN